MNKAFRLSLLYILLIIPQHGNSPIPRMESWMEMDQGDGFVDRDLTSSLTGAESFGSAHKNYQNSLIRKKQTEIEGELGNEGTVDEFSGGTPDRMQRRAAIIPNLMQNPYGSYGYNNYLGGMVPNQFTYQQPVSGMNGYQDQRYRMPMANGNERGSNFDNRFDNRYPSPNLTDLINPPLTSKDIRSLRMSNGNPPDEDNSVALSPRLGKCCLRESGKFDPDEGMMDTLNREDDSDETEYNAGSEESQSRLKGEMSEDDLADIPMEGGEDENLFRYNREDEEDPAADESDYYSEMRTPVSVRGDNDVDYSQINSHGTVYKREETKRCGVQSANNGEELSSGREDKLKSVKQSRSINLKAESPKEGRDLTKVEGKHNKLQNSNVVWTNAEDSQKAGDGYQENVQYHRGSTEWQMDNYAGGKKRNLQERRNKREDEDEQKNMKTGTDEGGGEYEDEEGKGHNDEEEYYEETETDNLSNRNLYKRETGKDEEENGSKGSQASVDVSSDEYELNADNAPVENEEKSKKSSWREGANRKKSVSRRGMKIWDEWSKWSPCSVSCGVGRKTRWRHCIGGGCARGEKEALIKKCTFPAC